MLIKRFQHIKINKDSWTFQQQNTLAAGGFEKKQPENLDFGQNCLYTIFVVSNLNHNVYDLDNPIDTKEQSNFKQKIIWILINIDILNKRFPNNELGFEKKGNSSDKESGNQGTISVSKDQLTGMLNDYRQQLEKDIRFKKGIHMNSDNEEDEDSMRKFTNGNRKNRKL